MRISEPRGPPEYENTNIFCKRHIQCPAIVDVSERKKPGIFAGLLSLQQLGYEVRR
jgi:hypothetical protein